MSWIHDELVHLSRLAQKWQGKAILEAKVLEADAAPFIKQAQTVLTADAYAIAKTELTAAMAAALSGGGPEAIGAAIAATIPGLLAKLQLDGVAAAKNVLYGIAAQVQAQITAAQPAA